MISRRQFIKLGGAAIAGLALTPSGWKAVPVSGQGPVLLDPLTQPKFVNPLPNPLDPGFIFQPEGGNHYEIGMYQFTQSLGLVDPVTLQPLSTTVWGYGNAVPSSGQGPTYPGRTFQVNRDQQVTVRWTNDLSSGENLPHLLPVDTTLHMAHPEKGIPVVPHVHGGHTESDSDGLPEYWFTAGFDETGPRWVKETYVYDNDQEAGTVWYHDHALGITRLNVYAGLAGFYLIRDGWDTGQPGNGPGLPTFPYEVPIVIQDRLFTADGQLFYPTTDPMMLPPGAPDPSVLPEFFGNVILVNGQAWPVLDVEPRKYRLRLLNGSDSRFYNLRITPQVGDAGPQIVQIGTDTGLLNAPVPLDQLTFGPGERADVVVDFAGFEGQLLIVRNNARSPFPKGATPNPRTEGRIMAFRVGTSVNPAVPDNPLPASLRPAPIAPLGPAVRTRQLLLFEGTDKFGRLQPLLGIVDPTRPNLDGTLLWDDSITENPNLDDIEIWEVFNTTADAHPIHLHLVSFQILNRQGFNGTIVPKENIDPMHPGDPPTLGGVLTNIKLKGQPKPPAANEAGWKDTAQMFPGEVTRVIAKFDRPGRYVWHCHILSHEDHEMMRSYYVGQMPGDDPAMMAQPADQAPTEQPPAEQPPADQPPAEQPPTEAPTEPESSEPEPTDEPAPPAEQPPTEAPSEEGSGQ